MYRLQLDRLLCSRWEMAMSSGILRYDLGGVTVRTVAGQHGFIVQVGRALLLSGHNLKL